MMVKFTTADTPTVRGTVGVDGSRGLVLALNGVDILYVSSNDGAVHMCKISPEEQEMLIEENIETDGDRVRVCL